jgi:hypothetical protein
VNRYHASLVALVTFFLAKCVVVPGLAATLEISQLYLADQSLDNASTRMAVYDTSDTPVIRALSPAEAGRYPAKPERPVWRERFAILTDPIDGRELVERTLATQSDQSATTSSGPSEHSLTTRCVHNREHIEPGYIVPVAHGTK